MCQITLVNLHNELLNAKMFLFLGTIGSQEHKDGWGMAKSNSPVLKTSLPMYLTSNTGTILRESLEKKHFDKILLGHIRKASPSVPVCDENSHPFEIDGVKFVHNGKLTPFEEKNFVMETVVEETDPKDATKIVKKYIKRSDSLIFFEHFMKLFKENQESDLQKKFVATLNLAMKDFYGTFAFVFIIDKTYFLARGKTKELSVSYLRDDNDKNLGWVVNTSKILLNSVTNFLGNLEQLENKNVSNFSAAELLKEESIFVAENTELTVIGKVEENYAPTTTYTYPAWNAGQTFPITTGKKEPSGKFVKDSAVEYAKKVYEFMVDYSLTLQDIHNLILGLYDVSSQELEEYIAKHFCNTVIPILKNGVSKAARKRAKKEFPNGITSISYFHNKNLEYPWILNTKENQMVFLDNCAKQNKGELK